MPKVAKRSPVSRKTKAKSSAKTPRTMDFQSLFSFALIGFCGATAGLSAPGFEQWYLAWIGFVPLFFVIAASTNLTQAFSRSFVFGLAYNLVYLNWYFGLHPLTWMNFNEVESIALASLCWLVVSIHQGLIIGLFGLVAKLIPGSARFTPSFEGGFKLPIFLVYPLLYVLIVNRIGNYPDLLGVPWSCLEYSQYRQLPIIQICSIIGGIGLGYLIIMSNVILASVLATLSKKNELTSLSAQSSTASGQHLLVLSLIIMSCLTYGSIELNNTKLKPDTTLSIMQGGINIDMQKSTHSYTLSELIAIYGRLLNNCPKGILIWTENAMPTFLNKENYARNALTNMAYEKQVDMVVGAMDGKPKKEPYNAAYGINKNGKFLDPIYHKRFLVPFGEYMPELVHYMPEWMQRLTNTPAGSGFKAGRNASILAFQSMAIGPLICFETISPELTASSVRSGAQLLVNLSDLAWFHDSMVQEQMLSFAVLRAVESQRYLVFAANTGPSAIIEPSGKIQTISKSSQPELVIGKVKALRKMSLFSSWYR